MSTRQIPKTADAWVEKHATYADDEKLFQYWMETMGSKLADELKEKIDFIDYLISYVIDLEDKKEMGKISELISEIYQNNIEFIEENSFHYIEKHLLDIKLFKRKIKYNDLEYFIDNAVDSYDTLLRYLRKLLFYNHSQIVNDISQEIFSEIEGTEALIAGAEQDIAEFIYFYKWQKVYNKLKKGLKINKEGLVEYMHKYNFGIEDYYDQFIGYLTKDSKFVQAEELFKNERNSFLIKFEFLFMRYMYEEKGLNFAGSHEIWYQGINALRDNRKENGNDIDSLNEFFLLDRRILRDNLYNMVSFLNNQYELIFAITWGMPYFYDFLYRNGLISEIIYSSALRTIKNIKEEVICSKINELWKYNFVHKWQLPERVDKKYFEHEKALFEITFVKEKDKIDILDEKNVEKEFNSAKDFSDIGRNDSCPCGSGRKYKKCCLNRMDQQMRKKRKAKNNKINRNLCWSKEEIEKMNTEEIIDQLFYFGVYFNEEVFLNDIKEQGSVDLVVEKWYQKFDIEIIDDFNYEFIKLAPEVLVDRLT